MTGEFGTAPVQYRIPSEPDSFGYFLFSFACIPGIAVAGMLYPLVVAAYTFFRTFVASLVLYGFSGNSVEGLFFLILPLFVTCMLGLVFAFVAAWIFAVLVGAFNASLGLPLRPRTLISCVGGLAGFAPMSLLFLYPESLFNYREAIEAFLVCPCLAALMGQTGARWWARRSLQFPAKEVERLPLSQFKISHVLVLTGWLAVALAVLRLTLDTNLPLLVALYFPVQLICLGVGMMIDKYIEFRSGIRYVE